MPAPQAITFILGSIVVIFGAYFATCMVARGSQKVYRGRLIQVLDRFSLAKDKSLMLIAVYDKIYLVAFAAGNVTLLDNIDPETAAAFAAESMKQEDRLGQAGSLAMLIISRLRSWLPLKQNQKKAGTPLPYEAYLADEPGKHESFSGILHSRLEKEARREEEQSQ